MLKQASVSQVRSGELNKDQGYLSVTMRTYPRGLKKELIDEYRADLAPDLELFREFKELQASVGHEQAFEQVRYEDRFELGRRPLLHLEELVRISQKQDVYLICQCDVGQYCHREILMLMAQKKFGAEIAPIHHSYEKFLARLKV